VSGKQKTSTTTESRDALQHDHNLPQAVSCNGPQERKKLHVDLDEKQFSFKLGSKEISKEISKKEKVGHTGLRSQYLIHAKDAWYQFHHTPKEWKTQIWKEKINQMIKIIIN
tara:strand:+ start:841 stop:1176 length:336 start_codon:yes stop_codon:yes gene_type:complete